jgi:hypothetical protein
MTISDLINKTNIRIRNLDFIRSVIVLSAALIVIRLICLFIFEYCFDGRDVVFAETPNENLAGQSYLLIVLQVVIIGPLFETFFSQKCLYFILSLFEWFQKSKGRIIIVGALAFGGLHFFTLSYIIVMCITGAFFMYAYTVKHGRHAYWTTACLHAIINGYSLFMDSF